MSTLFIIFGKSFPLPGFPGGSLVKNPPGDASSVPGLGRSPGEGNGKPTSVFLPGNPMDRRAWQAIVHRVTKEADVIQWLNNKNNFCL